MLFVSQISWNSHEHPVVPTTQTPLRNNPNVNPDLQDCLMDLSNHTQRLIDEAHLLCVLLTPVVDLILVTYTSRPSTIALTLSTHRVTQHLALLTARIEQIAFSNVQSF